MKIVGWTVQNNGQLRGFFTTPEAAADWLGYSWQGLAGQCTIAPIMEAPERPPGHTVDVEFKPRTLRWDWSA